MEEIKILSDCGADRIDAFIAEKTVISRSRAVKLIENGEVTVNGQRVNKKSSVRAGDEIIVIMPDAVPLEAKAEDIPLDIVYEDGELLRVGYLSFCSVCSVGDDHLVNR